MENFNQPDQPWYRRDLSRLSHGGKTGLHRVPEDFNTLQQGIWVNRAKWIADPKLKAEDCKSSAAAANF